MARRIVTAREQYELLSVFLGASSHIADTTYAPRHYADEELETEFSDVQPPHLNLPLDEAMSYRMSDDLATPEDSWFPDLLGHVTRHGIRRPLDLSTDGKWAILNDGHHRLNVANTLGMQDVPIRVSVKPSGYYDSVSGPNSLVKPLGKAMKNWIYDHGRGMGIESTRRAT